MEGSTGLSPRKIWEGAIGRGSHEVSRLYECRLGLRL